MIKSGKQGKIKGGLAESPSHLMHRALQLALDIYAEEAGPDGLTQRQFAVLEAVAARSGLTQTDLVKATGIDRSTLADLVARGFDADTVRQVEKLLYVSEWKRYQAAPGPRISTRAFWLDRRYPLVNRWRDRL